jgi:hypothetical protein
MRFDAKEDQKIRACLLGPVGTVMGAKLPECPLWVKSRHCLSGKGQKRTLQETALYNPSIMNARDFVALIRMAVISFVF